MNLVEIRGKSLREALERASARVGGGALVVSRRAEGDGTVVLEIRTEKAVVERALPESRAPRPGTADVERFLRANGVSETIVGRICEAVAGRLQEGVHPLDLAAEEIGMIFPIARISRTEGVTQVMTVLGAAGVGKTTALAKLALRLARSGRRVAVASMESARLGAIETWRVHAASFGIPFVTLREGPSLCDEECVLASEIVLLDTTGRLEHDVAEIVRLRDRIADRADRFALTAAVVLSASSSPIALDAVSEACAPLWPSVCIVTKLDETRVAGPVLEHVLRRGLRPAFFSDGPEIAADFHRSSPENLADLLLRGRILR
jgi:flagellar biosynthesis protein FlhF